MIEFAYKKSYHASIHMAPFEALYNRRCRSLIGWFELGEAYMFGPNLVYQAMAKAKVIQDRLKAAQSRQKSYTNVRYRDLDFEVGEKLFLKVSPMKGVMRFVKKGKLSPRYVGPYLVLRRVGNVAYELDLPSIMSSIHPVFHVSMLKKCIGDHSLVLPLEEIKVIVFLAYEEEPIAILDHQVRKLRSKEITSVKVLWKNQKVEESIRSKQGKFFL